MATAIAHRCNYAQVSEFALDNPETFRLARFDDGSIGCPGCGLILRVGCKRQAAYDKGCARGNTALVDCDCHRCEPKR